MHERVDSGGSESRGDVRLAFGLPLRSLRLGLSGKADAVEFHREEGEAGATRFALAAFPGGAQTRAAQEGALGQGPALRPGHVSGRDVGG